MAHISSLRSMTSNTKHHLPFSPQHLTVLDVLYAILLILVKHSLNLLGLAPSLQFSPDGKTSLLPELTLSAPLQISDADLETWDEAITCPSSSPSQSPQPKHPEKDDVTGAKHSPLLPAALTTPLLALLLSHPKIPILPFGSVNTKNRFEFCAPSTCRGLPSILKRKKLLAVARVGGPELLGRKVKRGLEFETVIEIVDGDGGVLFRQMVSTLQFLSENKGTASVVESEARITEAGTGKAESASDEMETVGENISLDLNASKRWARVCKDYNPIHMSHLAAKMFGFPSKIAHGNHVVALAIEMMRGENLALSRGLWEDDRASFVEVVFRRPVVLPCEAEMFLISSEGEMDEGGFEIRRGGKVCIEGRAGWL